MNSNFAARSPNLTVSIEDGTTTVDPMHPEIDYGWLAVGKSLGALDPQLIRALVANLSGLAKVDGKVNEKHLNARLALVRGIGPTNPIEAMLAVQMAAVHLATVTQAMRLQKADNEPEYDLYSRSLNKLARTFTMQAETLKKLRNSGEQKVTVEHRHYHLHQGPTEGQGGVEGKTEQLPHGQEPRMRLSERETVLGSFETDEVSVQSASHERVVSLPISRSPRRLAGGTAA